MGAIAPLPQRKTALVYTNSSPYPSQKSHRICISLRNVLGQKCGGHPVAMPLLRRQALINTF